MAQAFDEYTLQKEIARVWGEHGAHAEVYGMVLLRLNRYRDALRDIQTYGHTQSALRADEALYDGVYRVDE